MSDRAAAISVSGLRKSYGDFEAVRGIDFEVYAGEVFGLLGPNGAGKTTTVEILEGLRPRSHGNVEVLGYDPGVQVRQLKDRIGVCLQATNLPEKIKVHEALSLFASFYTLNIDNDKLLDRLQLSEKRGEYYSKLSGGQKQRVALALALVNDPQLLFLDEPTTGLDPQVRLEIHGLIQELRTAKRTILLTTHYIEEAERLCDRVAIIDEGRIVALGTPRELQTRVLGQSVIEIICEQPLPSDELPSLTDTEKCVLSDDHKSLSVHSTRPARAIVELVKWIDQRGIELADIHLKRPTLEDVFIELTGKEAARMKAYLAQISINLKLTLRDRTALFFNYLFPLIFFFIFGQLFHAEQGGASIQVFTMVLSIGILATGLFGVGIRSVQERELNILRRFKVAPISAAPILVSSLVTGLLIYLPSAGLLLLLARLIYGMPLPKAWLSLLIFVSLGVLAFRALGLVIASVANSMQESQIVVQILYFPMLFLSGTTIPLSILPGWVQTISQFLPATHLLTGMQAILGREENLIDNRTAVFALALTTVLATFIGVKLFRWEKEEKIAAAGKLWVVAVLAPFLVIGTYQAYSKETVVKSRQLARDFQRSRTLLIRDVRIFVGDGTVIESGAVLIRNGKIEQVYDGAAPDAKQLKADAIEASGKTVLPGLIDVHVHLVASGGFSVSADDYKPEKTMPRALAAYLYSGVMAVKSVGDPLDQILKVRTLVNSGQRLGAELFTCGPMFTSEGGHGTEYFKRLPEQYRKSSEEQTVRLPKTAEEARRQVDDLKQGGVDGIKAILETGQAGMLFNRLDVSILRAIGEESRAQNLPLVVHTGDSRDVSDALAAGADGIEHGSDRDSIPDQLFARMKAQGAAYDPTLVAVEGFEHVLAANLEALERPLVMQVGPPRLIQSTKDFLQTAPGVQMRDQMKLYRLSLNDGKQNLTRAWKAGVMLVTGSDAGNPLVLHGPAIHRELQLWVEAGIPPAVALQAATYNAARLLRADQRIGLIRPGRDASLMLVDGNPLKDIRQTEAIQTLIFKGERLDRTEMFDDQ